MKSEHKQQGYYSHYQVRMMRNLFSVLIKMHRNFTRKRDFLKKSLNLITEGILIGERRKITEIKKSIKYLRCAIQEFSKNLKSHIIIESIQWLGR